MALFDAVELLKHDHRMVQQLFRDYRSAASDEQRRGVVELMVRELSRHAALEELVIYPLAKEVLPGQRAEIDDHLAENLDVKRTLTELDRLGAGDDRTDELVAELEGEIAEHVREAEGDLLPKLRDIFDQQALDELGEALEQAKHNAPTRPHPHAPNEPPALSLAAPVAAIYDRLRDRLQGRPLT